MSGCNFSMTNAVLKYEIRAMNHRVFFSVAILLSMALLSHAQKAYDVEVFKGSTKSFDVSFRFAVGLGEASEATLLNKSTKQKVALEYDSGALGKMELIPASGAKGMRIIVAVDPNDLKDHSKLKCTVLTGDSKQDLTLVRSRE